jgi:(1->4)-alpha-D-glucan 1-alpha-D-glucosylmutase
MLIKLTAPGVPDMYQGTDLWDLSLVDPDNRRPVDFEVRRGLLDEVRNLTPNEIMARMDEGLPKLWVVYQTLALRKQYPDIFRLGTYTPAAAHGKKRHHVVAYARGDDIVTVVPRLVLGLRKDWADTWVELAAGTWVNAMTGDSVDNESIMMRDLFATFPVALLLRET